MAITSKLMTAGELSRLPRGRARHELVRGVLHTRPLLMWCEGQAVTQIMRSFWAGDWEPRLGAVLGNVGFQLTTDPDTVRAANVVFIRRERLPSEGRWKGYVPGAPDLAVEVVSPDDLYLDFDGRIAEWLEHGAKLVFVVSPRRRVVTVHRPGQRPETLGMDDTLSGEDVVPGWSMAVRDLFDQK